MDRRGHAHGPPAWSTASAPVSCLGSFRSAPPNVKLHIDLHKVEVGLLPKRYQQHSNQARVTQLGSQV